jgi:hypothetical protein
MAAQETYQSRQLERLPSGNAAEDQSADEQASYGVENSHPEGLSNASLDQAISLTIVYHNVKRPGARPVHFGLSGLGATSTIEEIATRGRFFLYNHILLSTSLVGMQCSKSDFGVQTELADTILCLDVFEEVASSSLDCVQLLREACS